MHCAYLISTYTQDKHLELAWLGVHNRWSWYVGLTGVHKSTMGLGDS